MRGLGVEHFYIELIEEYPCENKDQLNMREGYYVRLMGTLNQLRPGALADAGGEKEYNKQKYEKHKEYYKQYYEVNKDHKQEYLKRYYEENKEALKKCHKQYRETNKEVIRKHYSTPMVCEICGSTVTKRHMARHQRTKKCQDAKLAS